MEAAYSALDIIGELAEACQRYRHPRKIGSG